jgi:hypothetical protein
MTLDTPDGQRAREAARALVAAYLDDCSDGEMYREIVGDMHHDISDPDQYVLLARAVAELATLVAGALTPDEDNRHRTPDASAVFLQALVAMTSVGLRTVASAAGRDPLVVLSKMISTLNEGEE